MSWPRLRGEPQLFRIEKKMVRGLEVSLCQLFHYDDKTPEAHPELASNSDGPLIVLEPGQKYRPEHNRTFVFNTGRYAPFGLMLLVNGTPQPDPLVLHIGTRYRLRLINIAPATWTCGYGWCAKTCLCNGRSSRKMVLICCRHS